MRQITVSNLKLLKVAEVRDGMPFELIADGVVIAVVVKPGEPEKPKLLARQTKCPNCKMVYNVTEPDGKPGFFTMKHPKG